MQKNWDMTYLSHAQLKDWDKNDLWFKIYWLSMNLAAVGKKIVQDNFQSHHYFILKKASTSVFLHKHKAAILSQMTMKCGDWEEHSQICSLQER